MPRNHELVTRLSQITDPSEIIHVITMPDIIAEIAQRLGEDALNLSPEDFQLARDEVKRPPSIITWMNRSTSTWASVSGISSATSNLKEKLCSGSLCRWPHLASCSVIRICFLRSRRSPGNSPQTPSQIYSFDVKKGR